MTKRKTIVYLVILGLLFLATLFLIFFQKSLFNIGADVNPVCGNNICEAGETLAICPNDCVKKNLSIQTGLFINRGASNEDMNFFSQNIKAMAVQFKLWMTSQYDGINNDETTKIYGQTKQLADSNPADLALAFRYTGKIAASDYDIRNKILDPAKNSNTASCFLRNPKTGNLIQENPNIYIMDITSQCWKNYLVSFAKDKNIKYDLNGLFIDQATPSLKYQINGYKKGTLTDADLPTGYAANWDKNVSDLIDYVKKNVGGLTVIWNGIKCDIFTNFDCNPSHIPYGDGFMFEGFSFNGIFDGTTNSAGYLDVNKFQGNLDYAIEGRDQGKIVYISNAVKSAKTISDQSVQDLEKYLLSSYLLASGEKTYYGITINDSNLSDPGNSVNYTKLNFFNDWNTDVGQPTGAYAKTADNVYSRSFSKALVEVNPNTEAKTITLDKIYYTPEGQAVSGDYILDPHHGQILLLNKNGGGNGDNGNNNNGNVNNNSSNQNQTSGGVAGLISTGSSIYVLILIVLVILLIILLKQYAKKD